MLISKFLVKKLSNYENDKSIGSKLRGKRIAPLTKQIEQVFSEHGFVNIIDIGGDTKILEYRADRIFRKAQCNNNNY